MCGSRRQTSPRWTARGAPRRRWRPTPVHPGERVRSPRILVQFWEGDPEECHSRFRRLIYTHYVPRYRGEQPLPFLFANTVGKMWWPSVARRIAEDYAQYEGRAHCGWMNDRNEASETSLIEALAPLGVEATITDAGWFEGGWNGGVGNWTVNREHFPNGMGPVALAVRESGTTYGLWFSFETSHMQNQIAREHPEEVAKLIRTWLAEE